MAWISLLWVVPAAVTPPFSGLLSSRLVTPSTAPRSPPNYNRPVGHSRFLPSLNRITFTTRPILCQLALRRQRPSTSSPLYRRTTLAIRRGPTAPQWVPTSTVFTRFLQL